MVPPLGITFSLVLSKVLKKPIYAAQEVENIKVAFPMGLCMISEGVIPIAMNDLIRTCICTATGCELPEPSVSHWELEAKFRLAESL